MSVVLVTGGAGYVGSHTAQALIEAGHRVVIVDDLSTGHRAAVPSEALLIEASIADERRLEPVFAAHRPQAILHFASRSLVGESMNDPIGYFRHNLADALPLFACAIRHDTKKVVLSSTANLFGTPERIPIDETAAITPSSPYGDTKHALERLLHWLGETAGLRWATLRYFNAAGADLAGRRGEDHRPETHLVPIVLAAALGERPHVEIRGTDYDTPDGTCIRDYVHVCDLAEAHVAALAALDEQPQIVVNLGSGRGQSVRQVIDLAREITGRKIATVEGPRRAGDPPVLVASAARAIELLGWHPNRSDLRTILETAWGWHRAHPRGFSD